MNRKEEIRKELEEFAPFLARLENKMAFKVPKGYFDELPEGVLESVSPLNALKAKEAFSVPVNYFESLPDLVLEKVQPKQDTEAVPVLSPEKSTNWLDELINSIAMLFQPRYAMRLAAVAILLIGGVFLIQNIENNSSAIADAEVDPLEEYGLTIDDLTDDDLALLLSDVNIEESMENPENIDALIDHMLENIDDISDEDLESLL